MKILCIETSSKICGVAVLEDTKLIKKQNLNNGLTHSETLMPLIKEILDDANLRLKDIDLLVCDIGPGSFTGIRIGIATVKAFADSLNIPCVGISSLEALAYSIKNDGIICSTIDCRNDNCYFALYSLKDNSYEVLEIPSAKSDDEVRNLLDTKYSEKTIQFIGDGLEEKSTSFEIDVENLGIAGYKKYIANNKLGEEILPMYLKKSQAERLLEEKNN